MKTQRERINQNAVSAVIGVIIMVAITIAMAAVAYAYFTGMIGEQKQKHLLFPLRHLHQKKQLR